MAIERIEDGYKCDGCKAVILPDAVDEEEVKYECGNCGNFLRSETDNENHQCPQCKQFGSREIDGLLCPECQDGSLTLLGGPIWYCATCQTTYDAPAKSCKGCRRRAKQKNEKAALAVSPIDVPLYYDGVCEDDLPNVTSPVGVLSLPTLPKFVKVGELVYEARASYLKTPVEVLVAGEPFCCSYSIPHSARDAEGGWYYPDEREHPAKYARKRGIGEFKCYWIADGMNIVPAGARWGDYMGDPRKLPDDIELFTKE